MVTKAKLLVKGVLFAVITCLCVGLVNSWLTPKYYYNGLWPATNTFQDFYRLERDSVDVLLLGSSHMMCAVNPQVLYDEYGITSYNLSSEQQSFIVTYYWLREALKYQSPKAVVIDTYMLYKYYADYVYNDMNSSEPAVRKAMDNMRLSPLKWEAARTIAEIDPTQDSISYLLPNIRYHSRWTGLGEEDFSQDAMVDHGGIKGYSAIGGDEPSLHYTPFRDADADAVKGSAMMEPSATYLRKILDLCREKNIPAILINIPSAEPVEQYRATRDFADECGVPYYDFNEESLYNAVGYNASEDLLSHPNYRGAEKISRFLGDLLTREYGIAPRQDASFDATRLVYQHKLENLQLPETDDLADYLALLDKDRYTVFLFAPTAFSAAMDDDTMNALSALGFAAELRQVPDGTHYWAVKDQGQCTEQLTGEDLHKTGSIREGLTTYAVTVSTASMTDKTCRLTVDGQDCSGLPTGLNIVVYDNEFRRIVDRVNFDTTVPEHTATHYGT